MIWLIATGTMILDHVGAILYPDMWEWRLVGRLAFPLFAHQIHEGMQRTSDKRAYIDRLMAASILGEAVHWLAFGTWGGPVLLLTVGAILLTAGENVQKVGMLLAVLAGPGPGAAILPVAWRWGTIPTALVMASQAGSNVLQWFALAAIPAALLLAGDSLGKTVPRWAKYVIYPGHLLILLAAQRALT